MCALKVFFYATFNTVLKREYGRNYVKINSINTHIVYNIAAYPCADQNVAVVCNGWMKEFSFSVEGGTRLSDGHDFRTRYVCGGSGNWLPTEELPNCTRSRCRPNGMVLFIKLYE